MSNDAVEIVTLRNNFYRDNYRRVVLALLLMILVNIILALIIAYQITHRPEPRYFATSTDGRITPLYALSDPVVTREELLQWATRAATAAYTYDFVTYRAELQDVANEFFTPEGWKEFRAGLERSRNLETIVDKKLVSSAVATGAPIIQESGMINGRYAWKVQLPMLVTFESASMKIRQPLLVTMVITRVSTLDNPKGIAIAQFYATERTLSPNEQ